MNQPPTPKPPHRRQNPEPPSQPGQRPRVLTFRAPADVADRDSFVVRLVKAIFLRGRRRRLFGGIGVLLTIAQAVVMLVVATRPAGDLPIALGFDHADKVLHGLAFAWLGAWAMFSMHHTTRMPVIYSAVITVLVAGLGWGTAIEFAQSFVPDRVPELLDIVADSIGCVIVTTILLACSRAD